MTMSADEMQNKALMLDLMPGDLLVDSIVGTIGILMHMEVDREVGGYNYQSNFWKVYWISSYEGLYSYNGPTYVEEYGLKMSIVIGIYDYHPASGDNKQEKI